MDKETFQKFLDLATELSPENLTCDGELPQNQVRAKLSRIKRDWKELERKVGKKVTENEVWDMHIKKKFAKAILKIAKQVLSYMEVNKTDIADPKHLLDKANKILSGNLRVNNLPHNWGFNDFDFERPSSIYTSVDETGKFDSTWFAIKIFAHTGDKPAPSGQGKILVIDKVIIPDRKIEEVTGKKETITLR